MDNSKDYMHDLLFWLYKKHDYDWIDIKPWIKESGIDINNYHTDGRGPSSTPKPLHDLLVKLSDVRTKGNYLESNGNWYEKYYMGQTFNQIPFEEAVFQFKLTEKGLAYVIEFIKIEKTTKAIRIAKGALLVSIIAATFTGMNMYRTKGLEGLKAKQDTTTIKLNSLSDTVSTLKLKINHSVQPANPKSN